MAVGVFFNDIAATMKGSLHTRHVDPGRPTPAAVERRRQLAGRRVAQRAQQGGHLLRADRGRCATPFPSRAHVPVGAENADPPQDRRRADRKSRADGGVAPFARLIRVHDTLPHLDRIRFGHARMRSHADRQIKNYFNSGEHWG